MTGQSAFDELREAAMDGAPLDLQHRRLSDGLLARGVPEPVVRAVREQAVPGIALFELGDDWSGSRVGGTPRLPRGTAWPRDADGVALTFIAALELAELPVLAPLPETGTLLVYWAAGLSRVFWVPEGAAVADAEPPGGTRVVPAAPLTGALMPLVGELEGVALPESWPRVLDELDAATGRHQLLGPVRGPAPSAGWVPLARVESDGSTLQLLIGEADLRAGRFERVEGVLSRR